MVMHGVALSDDVSWLSSAHPRQPFFYLLAHAHAPSPNSRDQPRHRTDVYGKDGLALSIEQPWFQESSPHPFAL